VADQPTTRRYLYRLGTGVVGLILVFAFISFVRTMMAGKVVKQNRQVQIVQLIVPPPPPPPPKDEPPPPPQEKTEEPLPKDEPQPPPDDAPPPAGPLGLDAEGTAGDDAFGLAARRGGSDLVGGNGSAIFGWYTNRLTTAILERLSADSHLGGKKFSISVSMRIATNGTIKEFKLATTTGNHDLDQRIEAALSSLTRMSEAPPSDMPQPINIQINSRT
jgi:protein TonB